jgi:hypothetical protein
MEHSLIFLDVSLPIRAGSILIWLDSVSFVGKEQEESVRTLRSLGEREAHSFALRDTASVGLRPLKSPEACLSAPKNRCA